MDNANDTFKTELLSEDLIMMIGKSMVGETEENMIIDQTELLEKLIIYIVQRDGKVFNHGVNVGRLDELMMIKLEHDHLKIKDWIYSRRNQLIKKRNNEN